MQLPEGISSPIDGDHRAPLGKARTEGVVLLEPIAQAVEALGDQFARIAGQRLGALVNLDAGDDAGLAHHFGERNAVAGLLTDGFVVEDGTGQVLGGTRCSEQQFAIGAAIFFGVLDADRVEALLDGAARFVDGDDALARGNHGLGGLFEFFDAHEDPVWLNDREAVGRRRHHQKASRATSRRMATADAARRSSGL